jgi:hypothetical protein
VYVYKQDLAQCQMLVQFHACHSAGGANARPKAALCKHGLPLRTGSLFLRPCAESGYGEIETLKIQGGLPALSEEAAKKKFIS